MGLDPSALFETFEGIPHSIQNHSICTHTLLSILLFSSLSFFSFFKKTTTKNGISKWPKSDEFDSRGWGEVRFSAWIQSVDLD